MKNHPPGDRSNEELKHGNWHFHLAQTMATRSWSAKTSVRSQRDKTTYGVFLVELTLQGNTFASNPQLAEDLRSKDVHTIVLFGIQSECCVLETSRGALANGFTVVLLRGAHSTYGSAEKTATQIEQEVEDTLLKEGVKITQWESWKP